MATPHRAIIPTGIEGLDNILMGGLLPDGFYLIQGDPGSGKTTLALQFIQSRVRAGDRCLYITLTESRRDLESTCNSHGWSLEGIEIRDLTRAAETLSDDSRALVFDPADTELTEITKLIASDIERV